MNARRTGVLLSSLALVLFSASASLAKEKEPPGDPPGNNGTIKVVASDPSDPDPGNEPHIDGCLLWLEFYGFDQAQTAEITFRAHPPTGDGELLNHTTTISEDPAGGGQDKDAVLGYNLASALAQYEPHPQQGYHVKVTSDAKEAPGGPKQKVFWLKCSPAPTGTMTLSKAVEGEGSNGPFTFALACNHSPLDREMTLGAGESATVENIPGGTTCVVTETANGGATSTRMVETPPDAANDGKVVVPGGGVVDLAVTNVFGSSPAVEPAGTSDDAGGAEVAGVTETRTGDTAAEPAAEVAGVSEVADATTLPRTGTSPWPLVGVATVLMAAGTVLLTGARRRWAIG